MVSGLGASVVWGIAGRVVIAYIVRHAILYA